MSRFKSLTPYSTPYSTLLEEAIRTGFGLIANSAQESELLADTGLDKPSTLSVLFHLARFYFTVHDIKKYYKFLDLCSDRFAQIPIFKGCRVDLFHLQHLVPWIRNIERINEDLCKIECLEQLIINKGLTPLLELIDGEVLLQLPPTNWRIFNTVRYSIPEANLGPALLECKERTYNGQCAYCRLELSDSTLALSVGSDKRICNYCVELIDSLLEKGLLPEPSTLNANRCSFCGREGRNQLLCGNGNGVFICLNCVEFSILGGNDNPRIARSRCCLLRDIRENLTSENLWKTYWALSRILQNPKLLRIKGCREFVTKLLGHPVFDVRARSVDICKSPIFGHLELLRAKLVEEPWQLRANAVLALGFQPASHEERLSTLNSFKELYHLEEVDEVLDRLITAIENLRCAEGLDFLEGVGEQKNTHIENLRQNAIKNLKSFLVSGSTSFDKGGEFPA